MADGRSNGARRMQTRELRTQTPTRSAAVILLALAGVLMFAPAAAADGNCGPILGGGTRGYPQVPNPTPLTLSFTMPGSEDAVAVTVTLTRGAQQDRTGPPGTAPTLNVRVSETDSPNPRPPTL